MKIEELVKEYFGLSPDRPEDIVGAIKSSKTHSVDLKTLKEQWDVAEHQVKKESGPLKDKILKDQNGNVTGEKKVNRIAAPFQKMIVNRAVSFGFGNPVRIEYPTDLEGAEDFVALVEKILYLNKTKILDRQIARELYRSTEVAEIWYFVKKNTPHTEYGFPCLYELKVKIFNPWKDDELYPIFDDYDNLIAFCRGFVSTRGKNKVEYLEIFTDEEIGRYKKTDTGWINDIEDLKREAGIPEDENFGPIQVINKIPVIYANQEKAEWYDVQDDIDRLEILFSRHAEINDYHAGPKTFIKGSLVSTPAAGEANGVIQGGPDSEMKVISWADSPESIRLEIETRLENIFKFTQTPDISFKSVKGLSQISGIMLKMLFMDAHLKVMDKSEIWDAYFQRRYSVIKSFIVNLIKKDFKGVSEKITLEPIFRPYMITDDKERIDMLVTANGGLPLISQKTSTELADLSVDPSVDFLAIQEERKERDLRSITEMFNYEEEEEGVEGNEN